MRTKKPATMVIFNNFYKIQAMSVLPVQCSLMFFLALNSEIEVKKRNSFSLFFPDY